MAAADLTYGRFIPDMPNVWLKNQNGVSNYTMAYQINAACRGCIYSLYMSVFCHALPYYRSSFCLHFCPPKSQAALLPADNYAPPYEAFGVRGLRASGRGKKFFAHHSTTLLVLRCGSVALDHTLGSCVTREWHLSTVSIQRG